MTENQILERALLLLGYSDSAGQIPAEPLFAPRAHEAMLQLAADLGFPPPAAPGEELTLSGAAADALPYGMAMFLSLGENDREKNRLFCTLYNAKRAAAKAERTLVRDVLPVDDGGVDA